MSSVQPDSALASQKLELVYVLISPSLVQNNDFVYVIEDFYRAKFTICAIKKRTFSRQDLQTHFKDCMPRLHNLDHLEQEFKRGDSVMLVLEKPGKAVEAANKLIGEVSIKTFNDFLKRKKDTKMKQF